MSRIVSQGLKNRFQMQPAPTWFTITTTEPDVITYDNDPSERRAKMFCGHVISSTSMKDYCQNELSKGAPSINCPVYGCNKEWKFSVVRYIAYFSSTTQELEDMETKISENFINKEIGIQKCLQCHVYVEKKSENKTKWFECPGCSALHGRTYYNCWLCFQRWKSKSGTDCGNKNCIPTDKKLTILKNCIDKIIMNRFTPSTRGCPKCGLLIDYNEGCTQMCCKGCSHYFCFYCLKGAPTKSQLTCKPYDSKCTIAPRQTSLPGFF